MYQLTKGENVIIGENSHFLGEILVGDNTIIEENVVIGHPTNEYVKKHKKQNNFPSSINNSKFIITIGSNCIIKSGTIIYTGVKIGDNVFCGHNVLIGEYSSLDSHTKVFDNSRIYANVKIGKHARINGFCCDRSIIGENVSMLGDLIHKYPIPIGGMEEEAPIIKDNCVIGWNAIVIGSVTINEGAYIGAGSIVTKNIPPYVYAIGSPVKIIKNREKIDLENLRMA